jgi:branched-chain amino acid transport system ATP-binding protein
MSAKSLSITGISKNYGGVAALQSVDVEIAAGEVHGIIGPNGAGKSTLVDIISGFTERSAGQILLGNEPLDGKPYAISRTGVSRTFQHTSLFQGETVLANLRIAHSSMARWFGRKWRGVDTRELIALLQTVGLDHLAEVPAESLPYGAQRRLAIAVALVSDPDVLLLDEPAAGMNPVESDEFVELVRLMCAHRTVVLIEHDMTVIRALCARTTVLVDGQVLISGPTEAVLADERVIDVYLGVST